MDMTTSISFTTITYLTRVHNTDYSGTVYVSDIDSPYSWWLIWVINLWLMKSAANKFLYGSIKPVVIAKHVFDLNLEMIHLN